MSLCGWNECRHGVVKRRTQRFATGCDPCRELRNETARRYRAGLTCRKETDTDTYSELGDYVLTRDANGDVMVTPKPGRPAFVEVTLE